VVWGVLGGGWWGVGVFVRGVGGWGGFCGVFVGCGGVGVFMQGLMRAAQLQVCSVLRACCSVLQCWGVCGVFVQGQLCVEVFVGFVGCLCRAFCAPRKRRFAVCCSVLQCGGVCEVFVQGFLRATQAQVCSVMQCVAVCYSVM